MKKLIRSCGHALRGIGYAFTGRNFQIQTVVAVAVIDLSLYFHITKIEWALVFLSIGLVLSLEATNSALEEVCNKFHPETHPHIALIKDLAAGAVLLSSLTAIVIGIFVFSSYIF